MAMVVNYLNVGGPGNVAPTLAQALNVNTVNVSLSPAASGDNSQVITHNFGLPASDITAGWPETVINGLDTLATLSLWYILSQNPNFSIVARGANTAGIDTANAQVLVSISRPHSIVR